MKELGHYYDFLKELHGLPHLGLAYTPITKRLPERNAN
jgi:hypothetical protein